MCYISRQGSDTGSVHAATRWRDSVCGTHVEYDQRPDVFRCASCFKPVDTLDTRTVANH